MLGNSSTEPDSLSACGSSIAMHQDASMEADASFGMTPSNARCTARGGSFYKGEVAMGLTFDKYSLMFLMRAV